MYIQPLSEVEWLAEIAFWSGSVDWSATSDPTDGINLIFIY